MFIWIANIVLLLIYSVSLNHKMILINEEKSDVKYIVKKTSFLLLIMFLQLLFLYVFNNHSIFPDIDFYLRGFDFSSTVGWLDVSKIQHFSYEIKFELGWSIFTKLCSSLFNNNVMLLFSTGFIIILSYFICIKKYSLIPWFSILLFIATVFYNSMFVLRQNLAAAICLFSIPYIVERKILKFSLLIFIAFSIHQTAVIFVLLYLLYPLKIDKKFFYLVIGMGILFYIGFQFALNFAATYLHGYGIYKAAFFTPSNITPFLISVSVIVFISYCYYPFNQLDKYGKLFFQMLVLFVMIDLSRIGLPGTIGRLNLYFYLSIILLIPNAIKQIKTPIIQYISILAVSVLYFILMIKQMNYGFDLIFWS
jgi:hypothetical protein